MIYDHTKAEKKWQEDWEKNGLYTADIIKSRNPFYNLWMFPYPSAEGLHAGHAFASTGSDIYGRFMRMQGKDVFQPIGYDSFGIHSENYAIKINQKPQDVVNRTTKHYEEQMRSLGHGYDWTRTVTTSEPSYYKWTQWLFTEMFKAGLAYKKKAEVNFCPSCKTVLADEQVISGQCERCSTEVVRKELDQWFFKITDYADRLLDGLDKIDWSERVKVAQKQWIGRSEGMLIRFDIVGRGSFLERKHNTLKGETLEVFTTRPDTLNAVAFLATSKLYEGTSNNEEGTDSGFAGKEKVGKFSGKYARDPLSGRKLPVWDTNYVTPGYGTGIIMGVPAHDERDREFAKKYKIDIVDKEPDENLWEEIEKKGWGRKQTNYHLRDWLVSRQRYWGTPIPMIDCQRCGWQPVDQKDLPVLLPNISDYKPEGTGKGPLANHPEFYKTKCPKCSGEAVRETDVMDTFVDSSWYFMRYPSVGSESKSSLLPWDPEITKKWLPVDLYFGGAEHSVLHLMYARFVTMVLHDRGYIDFSEPFPRFFAHGLMIKNGAKMSKSRGNVVNPDEYVKKFGADALRLYLAFMGPMDASPDFRDSGMEGASKFLRRVWRLFTQSSDTGSSLLRGPSAASRSASADQNFVAAKLHQTIKKVTEDVEEFKFNTAIAAIMEYVNVLTEYRVSNHGCLARLVQLLAPFAPHMAEELWHGVLGNKLSVHKSSWPKCNAKYLKEDRVTIVVQVNGKVRSTLNLESGISNNKKDIIRLAKEDKKVAKWIKSGRIKKEVFVPGKLVNFVI